MEAPQFFQKKFIAMTGQKISCRATHWRLYLPKDPNKKLVFIAGGIGITPFRSMIKYLIDTNQKRDIVVMYSAKMRGILFIKIFSLAKSFLGLRTYYNVGRFEENFITREIPDYKDERFIFPAKSMVDGLKKS